MSRTLVDSGIDWIGKIPSSWSVCKVKNKYDYHKKIAGKYSDNYERIALTLNGVIKRDKDDANGLQPENYDSYQLVYKGDLIFKLIDLENVNTSRIGKSDYEGITSPAYIVLTPKEHNNYGTYYFLNMWYQEIFNNIGGNGVRSALNKQDLLGVPYLNVPKEEQKRIADYLDSKCSKIDQVIEDNNKVIELLEEYKRGLIIKTSINGLNKKLVDSSIEWIKSIPADWNVKYLFEIVNQKKVKNKGMINDNLLSLSYGNIIRKNIDSNDGLLPENFETYQIVDNGDIILRLTDLQNDKRSLRTGLVTEPGIITSAYVCIEPIDINPEFLHYLLHSYDLMKVFYNMGSGVRQQLNFKELRKMKILVPSKDEQSKIVSYLNKKCSRIDKVIEYRKKIIERLEEYKKSLIYEIVTGKKEV